MQKQRARTAPAVKTPAGKAPARKRRRLQRAEREQMIVKGAIRFFAEHGFKGQTRELARRLGITQPLLYRYFPNKNALIERVYEEVFVARWNPEWETWIADRTQPLHARLVRFYQDYTRNILNYEWIRLFLFSGLEGLEINRRYLRFMRDRIWSKVIAEIRFENGRPSLEEEPASETEIELVWAVIASIFYIGVRRWVFGLPVPEDLDAIIEDKVKGFLEGAPAAMAAPAKSANAPRVRPRDL
ncbi:MAG: TetR/AcrR family transcriptional regulator [Variibacter sp.]|nr:TetR/AcrR family transcriptional regulator [Variibacter sp.]